MRKRENRNTQIGKHKRNKRKEKRKHDSKKTERQQTKLIIIKSRFHPVEALKAEGMGKLKEKREEKNAQHRRNG